jgi:hypothetical protein
MFQFRAKAAFVLAIFISAGLNAGFAQTSSTSNPLAGRENDPYSKYGIGELWNPNTAEVIGMGSITAAYCNPFQLNTDNPASLSFLQRTTAEGGAVGSTRTINGEGLSYTTGTFTPDYLQVGMPVGKRGGLAFGLRPYARSYYNLVDTLNGTPIGSAQRSYNGSGSLSSVFVGGSVKMWKHLSLGVEASYLFGNYYNNISLEPIDTMAINRAYISNFANYIRLYGVNWKVGLIYTQKLPADSSYSISVGGTFTMSQNLTERLNSFQIANYYLSDTTINDTTYNPGEQRSRMKLPTKYTVGATIAKVDLWTAGVNFENTNWSQFSSSPDTALNQNIAKSNYKFSLGGEYSPMPTKLHKHFARLTYRAGLYYGTDYLQINNTALPTYGVTLGASIRFKPTHFSFVNLHTSFDIGKTGVNSTGIVEQTYFRWTMGISFNDRWFIPRKYD